MKTLVESANRFMYENEIIEDEKEIKDEDLPIEDEGDDLPTDDDTDEDVDGSDISSDDTSLEKLDEYIDFMEKQDKTFISVITDQAGTTHKIEDLDRREQMYYMLINDAKDRRKVIRAEGSEESEDMEDLENDIDDEDLES